jgi:hypothetical protein
LSIRKGVFRFTPIHKSMTEVLTDHNLASFGDSFANFIYSLALSNRGGKPSGAKVKGELLEKAIRGAGLRDYLPSRMTRHTLADAAESLLAYAWLNNYVTIEESVAMLSKTDDAVEGFAKLLAKIKSRIKFS